MMAATMDGGAMDGGTHDAAAPPSVHARETRERPRRGLLLLLGLAAGWGALFSYSLAYLSDDRPTRPPSLLEMSTAVNDDPSVLQVASELAARTPPPAPPRIEQPDAAAGSGFRTAGLQTEAPPQVPAPRKVAVETPPAPVPAQSIGERAEFVGTWGPTGAACGARSRRRGYLPAIITPEGARAGRTVCSFRDGHRSGNAWQMAADCSERGRRWSSQVRLVVEGDRLTWTSGKGASSYVRCGRRAG